MLARRSLSALRSQTTRLSQLQRRSLLVYLRLTNPGWGMSKYCARICSLILLLLSAANVEALDGDNEFVDGRRRVALVLGVQAYAHDRVLRNPSNDAREIARKLTSIGFQVSVALDADLQKLERSVAEFSDRAKGADIALFYYAGHAIQLDGVNYLIPTDFDPLRQNPSKQLHSLDAIVANVGLAAKATIFLLDACRTNLSTDVIAHSAPGLVTGRGIRGFVLSEPRDRPFGEAYGLIVGYATQPGAVASDGEGDHSPYAAALLKALDEPDAEVQKLLMRVSLGVREVTSDRQRPEYLAKLSSTLYLTARKPDDCDLFAAEEDNNIGIPGLPFDAINSQRAVPACEAAVARLPHNPRYTHNLARALDKSGQFPRAASLYERSAIQGFDWSQNNLGIMYLRGDGVQQDFRKGIDWIRAAKKQGNRQAQMTYEELDLASLFTGKTRADRSRASVLRAALMERGYLEKTQRPVGAPNVNIAVEKFKRDRGITNSGITFLLLEELSILEKVFPLKR
jgi:hypothetical protein